MKKLTPTELLELFKSNTTKKYDKRGRFIVRKATQGETILTIVSGKLETINTANENDIVIRNIELGGSAETYILTLETYLKRYELVGSIMLIDGIEWIEVKPKGSVNAFQYVGEPISFTAPWGEEMMCVEVDWIGNPVGGSESDIYRIEKEAFEKTYL